MSGSVELVPEPEGATSAVRPPRGTELDMPSSTSGTSSSGSPDPGQAKETSSSSSRIVVSRAAATTGGGLPPVVGGLVRAAWAVALLGAALAVLARRDARAPSGAAGTGALRAGHAGVDGALGAAAALSLLRRDA
jgi:hypothetical protein